MECWLPELVISEIKETICVLLPHAYFQLPDTMLSYLLTAATSMLHYNMFIIIVRTHH